MSILLRRFLAGFAVCAALAAAPYASAQTTLSLNATDTCLNAGETTLTVNIDMTMATDFAVGGQFFLQYDTTRLSFVDATPGAAPFSMEIFQADDPMAGTIDYAVGVPFGDPGTMADTTMAVLTFNVIGTACDVAGLVSFRAHTPPTRVTNGGGVDHLAATNDLGVMRIDNVAPVLTLTSGLTATDNCADAPTLPGPGTYQYSTDGASYSAGDGGGSCGSSSGVPDVWYMYVPAFDGTLSVETCSLTSMDTVLEALTDCGGTVLACNDDSCGLQSRISFAVRACVPVKIRISRFSSGTGSGLILVNLVPPPPPTPAATDSCVAAPPVGEGVYPFNTSVATNDGTASCGSSSTSRDAWVQYVPTANGTATAETCSLTSVDTVLSAHSAPCGAQIVCNDDNCGLQSRVTFPATAGTPVWVRISGFNNAAGTGSVRITNSGVTPPPPPPAFTLNRVVKADAGACTAVVTFGATATDDCDAAPTVVCVPPSGSAFPLGTTTVLCTASDACGNMTTGTFNVTVLAVNEMIADVELAGVSPGNYTRCITFDLTDTAGCPAFVAVDKTLWFTNGRSHSVVDVPCGFYDCLTARDRLHTLRRTDNDGDFAIVGTRYGCDFTSSGTTDDSLIGGNLNDDQFIEILDFGIFVGQFAVSYGTPSTTCATAAPHADISGDGLVAPSDYTFIATNFLQAREADCCGVPSSDGPRDRISVDELYKSGQDDLVIADLNEDGWLDVQDVAAFLNGDRPCPSDWNRDSHVNSADFFNFIVAFFNGNADFNRDGGTDSQDFFAFLTAFLSGC